MGKVNNRRILISGGSGFIGYHLALHLSQDSQNHIVLVDNFIRGKRDHDFEELLKRQNIQLISADLTHAETFDLLGDGYDEVYHLAAIIGVRNVIEQPHKVLFVNTIAMLHLLDWFIKGGGEKLLFSSTSEVYAWTQQYHTLAIPTPEDVPLSLTDLNNPRSTYAGSKIFGELAVRQYCSTYKKPFAIVRYHNVYGPRMGTEHVIPEIYQRALKGQNPLIVYSPDHSRAFCYVTDAVAATISAMRETTADGHTINIGNDLEEVVIMELAQRILNIAGIHVDVESKDAANDPIVRRCPDITQAKELLNYFPEVTLNEGLKLTLKWYGQVFENNPNQEM